MEGLQSYELSIVQLEKAKSTCVGELYSLVSLLQSRFSNIDKGCCGGSTQCSDSAQNSARMSKTLNIPAIWAVAVQSV